jgi:hypothetical protein
MATGLPLPELWRYTPWAALKQLKSGYTNRHAARQDGLRRTRRPWSYRMRYRGYRI